MVEDKEPFRILVVDDDGEMLEFISTHLTSRGYAVEVAHSGGEAVEKARRERFDMVITDLRMPLMDGLACLEALKSLDPSVQVLMVSGQPSVDDAVSAMKKGAYDFLQKPFGMETLLFHVEKACEKKRIDAMIALYESGKIAFSERRIEQLIEGAMDFLVGAFRADEGSFMLEGPDHHLSIASARGLSDELVYSTVLKLGERVAGLAAQQARPFLLIDGLENYPDFRGIESRPRIRSSMIVPIHHKTKLLGVLNLNRVDRKENFSQQDLQALSAFTSQIAQRLHEARLYHALEEKVRELRTACAALEESKTLLSQKEKLASLGTLVAGVAHEISNPLTSVLGYAELMLHSADLPGETKEQLDIVYREADRCRLMIKDLLSFSKKRRLNLAPTDLQALVDETLKIVTPELEKESVAVIKAFEGRPSPVRVDADQLKQVFLNLIRNAVQAMESRPDKRIEIRIRLRPERASVEFVDNGPGISREALGKIFDPFFTTKGKSGTGLGLSISRDILRAHGGELGVECKPGQGAAFLAEIPL